MRIGLASEQVHIFKEKQNMHIATHNNDVSHTNAVHIPITHTTQFYAMNACMFMMVDIVVCDQSGKRIFP